MYTPEALAAVIKELAKVEELFVRPDSLPARLPEIPCPKREDYSTRKEFEQEFKHFVQDYDREFRHYSPYNVGCAKFTFNNSFLPGEVNLVGFKTYRDILWDIHAYDKRIRGDADWELIRPCASVNYSVENKVKWN
jgi:hypothetical protein